MRWVFATDVLALATAITIAHVVRYAVLPIPGDVLGAGYPAFVVGSFALFAIWMIALSIGRTRSPKILDSGAVQYQAVARASFNVFACIAIVSLVIRASPSRIFVGMAGVLGLGLLFLSRFLWRSWVVRGRAHGRFLANALVIGGVRSAQDIMRRFIADPVHGLRVVGVWVPDRVAGRRERIHVGDVDVPVMGTETGLEAALAAGSVDTVVVTDTEHLGHDGMRELAWALEGQDVDLLVAPNVVDVAGPRVHLEAHGNMPLIYLSGPAYSRARTIRRAVFDRCFALLVLLAASPILLVASLAIRLTSRGPIFYRSERIGMHGVPFEMFKFRTMVLDADQVREELVKHNIGAGPLFKLRNDPRVTPVGRILRRFSIDEIPQFYNVLRGDMSVVGPRPPLRVEVDTYDETVMRRLLIKQGITGLWQVSGRSDLSWEDSVRLDIDYVENWSMLRDLQIILQTLRAVLARDGAY
ncbi:MAG TPA: sugar transferase [Aeromicrobium sp.]|nr:sugar transferase [Aeromicrobium sp.]HKY56643.1 sugar transferase [Aeromicrobium sp.]